MAIGVVILKLIHKLTNINKTKNTCIVMLYLPRCDREESSESEKEKEKLLEEYKALLLS